MTEALLQQRIPVGLPGSPTSIGEFHQSYPGMATLFHSYCREHPDFGTCEPEVGARLDAEEHLNREHPEFASVPLVISRIELAEELTYRLKTVAALALTRGRNGADFPRGFIEAEVQLAVDSLVAKSSKVG